jgi:hypothetical protein
MPEPADRAPHQKCHCGRDRENSCQRHQNHQDKAFISGFLFTGGFEMGFQKLQVFSICAPNEIENITQKRDRAHNRIDRDIRQHPQEGFFGELKPETFEQNIGRYDEAHRVTAARKYPNNGVQSHFAARAGNRDNAIHDAGDRANSGEGRVFTGRKFRNCHNSGILRVNLQEYDSTGLKVFLYVTT